MTARVLSDALPFIQAHADRTVVIKYGGHAMEDEEASLSFAQDVVMLKQVLFVRQQRRRHQYAMCLQNHGTLGINCRKRVDCGTHQMLVLGRLLAQCTDECCRKGEIVF